MKINNDLKMAALEVADEVLDAVRAAGQPGLRFVEGCSLLGVEYNEFYGIAHELARLGHVKIGRGGDGHRNRVLLPNAIEPAEIAMSDGQRRVLDYLHSRADEHGLVRASLKEIGKATGMACPSFCLQRLDLKGYLDYVDLGGPSRASMFKVYPDGTGQKSDTWWLVKYGRPPVAEMLERGLI